MHIVLQGQAGLKGDDWRAGNHRVGQLSQLSQKIDLDGGRSAPAKMIANSRSWFNFNEIQVLAACLSLSLVCQVVLMCMLNSRVTISKQTAPNFRLLITDDLKLQWLPTETSVAYSTAAIAAHTKTICCEMAHAFCKPSKVLYQ